jgi:glucokinase
MAKRAKHKYWIGFDLGGTKMMACVLDPDFRIVGRKRRKTRPAPGDKSGLSRIAETIEQALEDAGVSSAEVAGMGIGSPGPLDLDRGILVDAPNLGWGKLLLRRGLERRFRVPVVVSNDVDAGTYGEYRFGAARRARCVVGVFPGTGIGGSCILEGRILRGQHYSCFEIEHCQLQPDGPLCGCGQRGCLEALASRGAIAQAVAAAVQRGAAPYVAREAGSDLAAIRSSLLARAIAAGDKVVERIVRDAAGWLGVGVAAVVNLVAPDIVVLGGGLVEAMPDLFVKQVDLVARARVMPAFRDSFKVKAARLGDDATAIGAAAWARRTVAD